MPSPNESHTHKLARHLLRAHTGRPDLEPGQWINERREAGQSWRRIASEVAVATGGELLVDESTVTNWGKDWAAAHPTPTPEPSPAA